MVTARESRLAALLAAGAVWGAAEATLFFIVPDVLITFVATRRLGRAVMVSLAATAGAVAGGLAMYMWGRHDAAGATAALAHVPAVTTKMLARVASQLQAGGVSALFLGPLTGAPYKIYAVESGAAGMSAVGFLLISVPARLARFALLAVLTAAVRQRLLSRWPQRKVDALTTVSWAIFYAAYFFSVAGS